jgi:hypothetical protein
MATEGNKEDTYQPGSKDKATGRDDDGNTL